MVSIGYALLGEQAGPRELVDYAARGEEAGFDFEVMSDHYFPWLAEQGHSPSAWPTLGAVARATDQVGLMTFVTCPIIRYHPAIVAQNAATVGLLSDGRFTLGLGSGENLNEHVVGRDWPPVNVRHEMLEEAVHIIRMLFGGGCQNFSGRHYRIDSAKLWDIVSPPPDIGIAVSGPQSCDFAGRLADAMIAVEPDPALIESFDASGGSGKPRFGQVPVCWDPDRDAAIERAHQQFRWFGGGWKVNSELPGPAAFAGATQFVRSADVADSIPCGPNTDSHVQAIKAFVDAGYTHVAIIQIGEHSRSSFFQWANRELMPAVREL